jgi:hypothetical protein
MKFCPSHEVPTEWLSIRKALHGDEYKKHDSSLDTFNHNVVKGVPSLVLDSQLNRINFGICIHN